MTASSGRPEGEARGFPRIPQRVTCTARNEATQLLVVSLISFDGQVIDAAAPVLSRAP